MFSEFLLMSMYASATRMIDGLDEEERKTQGALFERLAKEHLAKEMEGPTKIATIEGLMLLSGRECALGNVSQGWNHAGLVSVTFGKFRRVQKLSHYSGFQDDPRRKYRVKLLVSLGLTCSHDKLP